MPKPATPKTRPQGRPRVPAELRRSPFTLYLSAAELAECAAEGGERGAREGGRSIIQKSMKRRAAKKSKILL